MQCDATGRNATYAMLCCMLCNGMLWQCNEMHAGANGSTWRGRCAAQAHMRTDSWGRHSNPPYPTC
eukprot:5528036-Prorocentrum_lima.AAC.1